MSVRLVDVDAYAKRGVVFTVEQLMLEELCERGLNAGEFERAFEFAKREIDNFDEKYLLDTQIPTKQGGGVLLKDCWNTNANDYIKEALDELYRLIEGHAFTWCINMLHSRA